MKNIFKILICVLVITSCAGVTPSSKLSAEEKAKMKDIGVYSAFDNTMHIFLAGKHAYDHTEKEIKLPPWWSLNKIAKETVKEKLAKKEVRKIKSDDLITDEKEILKLARSQGFDTAIILLPKIDKNNPALKSGYGMVRYSQEFQKGYISFSINIYDVNNEKIIKSVTFDNDKTEQITFDLPVDFREYFNYHRDEVEKLMHAYEAEISIKILSTFEMLGL